MIKIRSIGLIGALVLAANAQGEIKGTYTSRCYETDGVSAIRRLQFSGTALTDMQTVYSDDFCGTETFDIIITGTQKIDAAKETLDFRIGSVALRPLSEDIADAFNQEELCGYDDWTAYGGKGVTGSYCGGLELPASGHTTYNKVREVKSDAVNAIQLGLSDSSHSGSTLTSRPVKFDTQLFYKN